jgi:hypothetical protein
LTPVLVSGGLSFAAVSAGFEFDLREHTCGVTTGGVAYCWGSNAFGQLGDGTSLNIKIVPVLVLGGHTFASVRAAGADHTCGVTTGGVAYCWGWNSQGVLGDGLLLGGQRSGLARRRHHDRQIDPGARLRRPQLRRGERRERPHVRRDDRRGRLLLGK